MNSTSLQELFDPNELRELLSKLRDEQLDVEGAARLDDLVTHYQEARRYYVQMTQLCSHLHWYAAAEGLDRDVLSAIAEQRRLPSHRSPLISQSSRRARLLAAVGVASAFYSVFAILAWGLRPHGLPIRQTPTELAAPDISPQSEVASLETTVNARWRRLDDLESIAIRPRRGDRLAIGSQWSLSEGSVALQFDSGARVNITAPAEFTITNANAAQLGLGTLAASVPPQAVGFVVTTPTSTIVDLGTEFGVSIDREGVTHVQVFVGKVRLNPTSAFGIAGAEDASAIVLEAGQVRRLTQNVSAKTLDICDVAEEFSDPQRPPVQFPRQVGGEHRSGLRRVEHGGGFGKHNLARSPEAKAFALDWFDGRTLSVKYPPHRIEHLNDGRYGNQFSWIGKSGDPAFAGIALGSKQTIASIAFGRDNGGEELTPDKQDYDDLWEGIYTLQYTTVENPDETTPHDKWFSLGTVEYRRNDPLVTSGFLKPMIRHRYAFPPVEVTGVRIVVPGPFGSKQPTVIDEIEVYPE